MLLLNTCFNLHCITFLFYNDKLWTIKAFFNSAFNKLQISRLIVKSRLFKYFFEVKQRCTARYLQIVANWKRVHLVCVSYGCLSHSFHYNMNVFITFIVIYKKYTSVSISIWTLTNSNLSDISNIKLDD